MKLSEMRDLLARHDIQLTKSLGQNFLHDAHQLERICAAAELMPADTVLEIGPGLGPLTELLLKKAGHVLAIEKDARLVPILRERFPQPHFELRHADAMDVLKDEPRDWRDWKLVANLPYSVASPILVELACGARSPKMLVATLQLEVAERLFALPDTDNYGLLTLLVQIDFEPHGLFKIPPGCFFPPPDVDSACVTMVRREQPWLNDEQRVTFRRLVKLAFSQRRKMMLKLLKQDWPKEELEAAFAALNISPQQRAEKLGLETFVALTRRLSGDE